MSRCALFLGGWLAFGSFLAGAIAGCGGSGSGSPKECQDPFAKCGADPRGAWTLDAICAVMPMGCTGGSSSVSEHKVSGGLSFTGSADSGTVSFGLDIEFGYSATIPKSCGYTCEALDELIGACDDGGDVCKCGGVSGEGGGGMLNWTLQDGSVQIEMGGSQGVAHFCAQDTFGRLQRPDGLLLLYRRN